MRILQICSARTLGGGERHLADLTNGLARRGHEVYAALVPASPLQTELSELPAEKIIELPLRNSLDVASALKLAQFVRRNQIEIVHAHLARDYPLAALAARRAGARLILTRHVLFPLTRIHKVVLRRVERVIAVSQAVADGLIAQDIFDREKIVLIHNGVDLDRFAKTKEGDSVERQKTGARHCVGTIGELAPIKGQETFLRAAAIVSSRRDDVDFIIAGEDKARTGENRRLLERMVDELELRERVRITGWADDVAELLRSFDVFVSSSRSESFGIAIIEAMANGVPVVSTMTAGAREIIDEDKTGRLVPIGDAEALAEAICELLNDPKTRERLATNALRMVSERFSLDRMVARTEQVYQEVLERRQAGAIV
ncbi:MAG TPA: glycosyltransferase family 4 protein [Pyrinomonadaceae bacterium]|nr:glycosyltransferase family 4 protein [Pyrinomonadaceae bacterium]